MNRGPKKRASRLIPSPNAEGRGFFISTPLREALNLFLISLVMYAGSLVPWAWRSANAPPEVVLISLLVAGIGTMSLLIIGLGSVFKLLTWLWPIMLDFLDKLKGKSRPGP